MTPSQSSASTLDQVLTVRSMNSVGLHNLLVLDAEIKTTALERLREVARTHYLSPDIVSRRLESIGASSTAAILKGHLPTSKTARSADFGEILATEVAERKLGYEVPVRRLRWKDGRNMALRGDDVVGIIRRTGAKVQLLKGEAKSRMRLDAGTVQEAADALDRDRGRPGRHSVIFVADRLRELGRDDLATELEEAVLESFRGYTVEHMLVAVAGNDPAVLLRAHLLLCAKKRRKRHAVGVYVEDHAKAIAAVYAGM